MQSPPEALAPLPATRAPAGFALGLSLDIDPTIEIPGIAAEHGPRIERPRSTRVRLDPGELRHRWSQVGHTAARVRELRDGEDIVLSVDVAQPAGYLLNAPGFARVLVAPDGSDVLCDPEPESSRWSILLAAQALPLAATLHGLEVLHASGVVMADGALAGRAALFTGPQGAGKSSLAAALLGRGAKLLSDDTVALEACEDGLLAYPGPGLLQLRANEHDRLSASCRAALGPAAPTLGKHGFAPSRSVSAVGLGALFLLERSSHGPPIERIEAVDPFALLASTFNLSVRSAERLTRHLDLTAALASTGQIYQLRIQPGIDATELAEIVSESLSEL